MRQNTLREEMKTCRQCEKTKPVGSFGKHIEGRGGLMPRCKECRNENCRAKYSDNLQQERERNKKKYQSNSEKIKEGRRARYETDRELILGYKRKYREGNRERLRESSRKYRSENLEKTKAAIRNWQVSHPDKNTEYLNARRARELGNGGRITSKEWRELKEFYGFMCLCCKRKEPEIRLSLDHVLPIKLGGINGIENAQPLCKSCNSSKGAKHIDYRRAMVS